MSNNYNRMVQIVLFFIISTLFFVSISTYSSYITPLATDIGITPTVIGVILGATGMVSMFVRFPIGILSQMFSKRKLVIQLGLLVTVVAFFIAFLIPSAVTLFIAKAVGGLTGATWVMYT
ncbi:MAG: MFS transporter, partial [Anaerovoracaceae bacterium]